MGENEIKKIVGKEVHEWYDCECDTMEVLVSLTDDTCAVIEKEQGCLPVCHVYFNDDDSTERDLPMIRALMENEVMETIADILGQANFKGYGEDEMFDEYLRQRC